MSIGAVAVLDAAVAFGARRYLDRVHADSSWRYSGQYEAEDDALLFFEFLHHILSYDKVILDNSSATTIGHELEEFVHRLNVTLREEWIELCNLGSSCIDATLGFVQSGICHLIRDILETGIATTTKLSCIRVPWAYTSSAHHDYSDIAERVRRFSIPPELVPFCLFVWRGVMYGAFAHMYAHTTARPCVYVAAPGRLHAMQAILSKRDISQLKYPRESLIELLRNLKGVPRNGYDFSVFSSLPSFLRSPLTNELSALEPSAALDLVVRKRRDHSNIRRAWAEQISSHRSSAVGRAYTQQVANTTVSGDLTQIQFIQAVADD